MRMMRGKLDRLTTRRTFKSDKKIVVWELKVEVIKALDRFVVRSQANEVLASLDNKRRKILVKSHSLLKISNNPKDQTKKASK